MGGVNGGRGWDSRDHGRRWRGRGRGSWDLGTSRRERRSWGRGRGSWVAGGQRRSSSGGGWVGRARAAAAASFPHARRKWLLAARRRAQRVGCEARRAPPGYARGQGGGCSPAQASECGEYAAHPASLARLLLSRAEQCGCWGADRQLWVPGRWVTPRTSPQGDPIPVRSPADKPSRVRFGVRKSRGFFGAV